MADNSQNKPNLNGDLFKWNIIDNVADAELLNKQDAELLQKYHKLMHQIDADKKNAIENAAKEWNFTWKEWNSTWFESSYVFQPADKIAYSYFSTKQKQKQELVFETPEQETKHKDGVAKIVSRYPWLKKAKT